jgi:hypothetical protein
VKKRDLSKAQKMETCLEGNWLSVPHSRLGDEEGVLDGVSLGDAEGLWLVGPLGCTLGVDYGAEELEGWEDGCALGLSLGETLMNGASLGCALGVDDGAIEIDGMNDG